MIYTLLVLSAPAAGQTNRTAAAFAQALLGRGHKLSRVFFLDAGVESGNTLAVYPQDELAPRELWSELSQQHGVELALCVTSSLRRGVLDAAEAERQERPGISADPAFTIVGLGQLIDAAVESDRVVTFGG